MILSKNSQTTTDNIQSKDFAKLQSPLLGLAYPNVTKCNRCRLNFLRQHAAQSEQNSRQFSQGQILSHDQQAFEPIGWIVLAIDGQVQYMTPRAEQLLDWYFVNQELHTLPVFLQHWFKHQITQLLCNEPVSTAGLSLNVEQAKRQLIIRLIPNPIGEYYLLLLEEQKFPFFSIAALELLGLTKRESEVLFWIAKDKSNAGIAKVLGCCEGTVRKHLENLYKKLGVQTRMGAVMVVLERLGLLQG